MNDDNIKIIKILAISGSLRQESSNTILLHSIASLAPKNIQISLYNGIGHLPLFNPDLDESAQPMVIELKKQIRLSDGILIASPEYAHGVTGVLKNALDWLVSSEEFVDKPIALINASSRAVHAQASLTEIIKTMSGKIINQASLMIPITPGKKFDQMEIISDPMLSNLIRRVITEFGKAVLSNRCCALTPSL
jgi:NAD(P)H-dependent FMN reductase